MRDMNKWRFWRKAAVRGMQMAALVVIVSMSVMPGMIARCRNLTEAAILLAVLLSGTVSAVVTGWLAVELDDDTNRQWREYRRMAQHCRYGKRG